MLVELRRCSSSSGDARSTAPELSGASATAVDLVRRRWSTWDGGGDGVAPAIASMLVARRCSCDDSGAHVNLVGHLCKVMRGSGR